MMKTKFSFLKKHKLILEVIIALFILISGIVFFIFPSNFFDILGFWISVSITSILLLFVEKNSLKIYWDLIKKRFSKYVVLQIIAHMTYLFLIAISFFEFFSTNGVRFHSEQWLFIWILFISINSFQIMEEKMFLKDKENSSKLLMLKNKKILVMNKEKEFVEVSWENIQNGDVIKLEKNDFAIADGFLVNKSAFLDYSKLYGEAFPQNIIRGNEIISGAKNLSDHAIYEVYESPRTANLFLYENKLKHQQSMVAKKNNKFALFALLSLIIWSTSFVTFSILGSLNIQTNLFFSNWILNYNNYIFDAFAKANLMTILTFPFGYVFTTSIKNYLMKKILNKNKVVANNLSFFDLKSKKIKSVIFDKTGTLTNGYMSVSKQIGEDRYNEIIFEMTKNFSHPFSAQIAKFLNKSTNHNFKFEHIDEDKNDCVVVHKNETSFFLGSYDLAKMKKFQFKIDENVVKANAATIVFAINGLVVSGFLLEDQIKPGARDLIQKLEKDGMTTILISADDTERVKKVAEKLGIKLCVGNLSEEDKLSIVNEYKKRGEVFYVGDGVSDYLALKGANVGLYFIDNNFNALETNFDFMSLDQNVRVVNKVLVCREQDVFINRINLLINSLLSLVFMPFVILGWLPILAIFSIIFIGFNLINAFVTWMLTRNLNKKYRY